MMSSTRIFARSNVIRHMRDDTPMSVNANPRRRHGPPGHPLPCLLLLAAGRSRRLGRPKGGLVAHGVPLLVQQLQKARAAGIDRALVVLGATAPRLERLLTPTLRPASLAPSAVLNLLPSQIGPYNLHRWR